VDSSRRPKDRRRNIPRQAASFARVCSARTCKENYGRSFAESRGSMETSKRPAVGEVVNEAREDARRHSLRLVRNFGSPSSLWRARGPVRGRRGRAAEKFRRKLVAGVMEEQSGGRPFVGPDQRRIKVGKLL